MSFALTFAKSYEFCRARTQTMVLDRLAKLPDPQAALAWRPGPGRAHVAWQLMHIGITEDILASERLSPNKPGVFASLWPRFRQGSAPDDDIPTLDVIRQTLAGGRETLLDTLAQIPDERLDEIPPTLAARKFTIRDVLYLVGMHEAHHQGQAHLTLNLYEAAHKAASI
jgi:hypothetical protein